MVPAIGCTEPIAVALCVAKATELLGQVPDKVDVKLSANILKNAMGVGIPGTGMIGLPIAIALGAIIGKPEKELEVLCDCNKQAVERGKQYIAEDRIHISLEDNDPDKLYINAVVSTNGHEAEARIKTHHTHFVLLRKDNDVILDNDKPACQCTTEQNDEDPKLTLRKVYDFALETDIDDLRFILEAKRLNEAAAMSGLRENYGHQLGKTMQSPLGRGIMGDSIFSKVLSITSCACDARMAGAMVPVMSNSGSGNQGICATMPVVVFASTGSSCGITYLMGGTYEQISYSVKNMIANLTGMICDGAKPSCTLKLTSGVSTAMLSAMLAMQHKYVTSQEGIIDDDVDQSIHNLTAIGSKGMDVTDRFVLDIMTHKSNTKKPH